MKVELVCHKGKKMKKFGHRILKIRVLDRVDPKILSEFHGATRGP